MPIVVPTLRDAVCDDAVGTDGRERECDRREQREQQRSESCAGYGIVNDALERAHLGQRHARIVSARGGAKCGQECQRLEAGNDS